MKRPARVVPKDPPPAPPAMAPTLAAREALVLAIERSAALRENAVTMREQMLQLWEDAARARTEFAALTAAQLREANERLVVAAVRAQAMTEEAEGAAAQMSHMASHDFLTGLPNRALLRDRLAQAIALAQRHGNRVALLFLDLDHFKHINDSLGHAVGDQLLQLAARRLQEHVRQSDTVCRQGGDEFVLLLADVEAAQDAAQSAEKLVRAMAEPYLIGAHRLHVTVSIGVSIYPDDGAGADAVLRNADTAMYHAKSSGRNNYALFTGEMNLRAVARQSVEVALRQALDQRQFVLHYQPKFNLQSGAITGVEALVRLQRSDRELVYPTDFVAIAEDCGLIAQIGHWVLFEACRQAAAWRQVGHAIGQIAVNVSAAELHGKDFLSGVRAILGDTGLDPRHLEFELTESGLMHDTQHTTTVLHALKDLGVQIAIDDFGTGYSSLSYLRRFPIDTLKIDQSFVHDIQDDTQEAILVGAIIAMGDSLKLRVVAEGIETRQQLAYLQSRHCSEGQGYYFGRPVEAAQFAALMASSQPH